VAPRKLHLVTVYFPDQSTPEGASRRGCRPQSAGRSINRAEDNPMPIETIIFGMAFAYAFVATLCIKSL
jgi:hypothetical protein